MKYFKCMLAGIVAMIVICGVIPTLGAVVQILFHYLQGLLSGGAGIEFAVHWKVLPTLPTLTDWLFLVSAFGLGFFWELWRLERRQLPPAQSDLF